MVHLRVWSDVADEDDDAGGDDVENNGEGPSVEDQIQTRKGKAAWSLGGRVVAWNQHRRQNQLRQSVMPHEGSIVTHTGAGNGTGRRKRSGVSR